MTLKVCFELLIGSHKIVSIKHYLDGFTLNPTAFLVTIELLANKNQADHWRSLVFSGKVIGGYGQT